MPYKLQPTSIILPRNFTFRNSDEPLPQTPAPTAQHVTEPALPPTMPRAGFKIRRRRRHVDLPPPLPPPPARSSADNDIDTSTMLPTIEMTEASEETTTSPPDDSRQPLADRHTRRSPRSPPRTPASQTIFLPDKVANAWTIVSRDLPMRPLSACSTSDCSESTISSYADSSRTFPSLAGSCTSPDSEAPDPFCESLATAVDTCMHATVPMPKKQKALRNAAKWTSELDDHLWLTYMSYVQDPRVTPFKMLPGIVPPLGVCHRVARQARRTWNEGKDPGLLRRHLSGVRPSTEEPSEPTFPGSRHDSRWPGSEASTRRRLRDLCRRKPSLSVHYQRLLKARSTSPFASSSSPMDTSSGPLPLDLRPDDGSIGDDDVVTPVAPQNVDVVYDTTDDMTRVDAPSTDATQPGEALPGEADIQATPIQAHVPSRPDGLISCAGRKSRAHQKSQSLQLELGIELPKPPPEKSDQAKPLLASPFDFNGAVNATRSLGRSFGPSKPVPLLRSPLELPSPAGPSNRSLKRRFKVDDDSLTDLRNLFVKPSSVAQPVRDRAFSLGAVHAGVRDLSSVFSRPPAPAITREVPMEDARDGNAGPSQDHLQTPIPTVRLGSPFGGGPPSSSRFNTFPRRLTPRGSDTMVASSLTPGQQPEYRLLTSAPRTTQHS